MKMSISSAYDNASVIPLATSTYYNFTMISSLDSLIVDSNPLPFKRATNPNLYSNI